MELDSITIQLIRVVNGKDIDLNNAYIRDNLPVFKAVYPFLNESDYVERGLRKIVQHYHDSEIYIMVCKQLEDKYDKRNYALLLCEFYEEQNNLAGIQYVIDVLLIEEFKFLGYRVRLSYFAKHYSEKDFFDTFSKINRKETLLPKDYHAIALFIKQYSANHGIELTKKMIDKQKWAKFVNYKIPMILGQAGSLFIVELEKLVEIEAENGEMECNMHEKVFLSLYSHTSDNFIKLSILDLMYSYAERIPKDIKVKGYPSKFWTLYLWRVGMEYLELGQKEKVEAIIKKLTGRNKDALKDSYRMKYKP